MGHWGKEIIFKIWCTFWPAHKAHSPVNMYQGAVGQAEITCSCGAEGHLRESDLLFTLIHAVQDSTENVIPLRPPNPVIKEAALFFGGLNLQDQPIQTQRNVVMMLNKLMAASRAK